MSEPPRRPARKKRRTRRPANAIEMAAPAGRDASSTKQRRVILAAAATAAIGGLAMVGTNHAEIGRWISLGGLLLLIYGIHTFGRLGEDDGPVA